MSKKLTAIFLVLIFALSTALIAIPAQAHFTLGRPTGTLPYRVRDFDPHAPGPTGYVWPGAGVMTLTDSPPNTGSGAPSPVTWNTGPYLPPGYQSPFSTNPPGAPTSWYQLAGNTYAPFGAILTSTEDHDNVGDLIFAINFTTTTIPDRLLPEVTVAFVYYGLTIYIPPEFKPPVDWEAADTSNIVTTITNNYRRMYVWKADVKDPFGPGWWVVYIDRYLVFDAYHDFSEWYYVRVNGMTAPKIAGRYMFKMFLGNSYPTMSGVDDGGHILDENIENILYPLLSTMPAENWPVLLVKGEVDPGIIEGTVRYGAWNLDLYNTPLQLPGRVRAVGVADDPYTGASTGRVVEARGYFNASAKGHYEVEGVAPGVYDIYASAAGYPEWKVASGVKILPGKSFHLDFLLQPGPIITGVIFSKHSFGEVSWPSTRPVTVEIYDSNEWPSAKPGYPWGMEGLEFEQGTGEVWTDAGYKVVDAHLKSFSPINLTQAPFTSYVRGNVIYDPATGYTDLLPPTSTVIFGQIPGGEPKLVAFPWEHDTIGLPPVSWTQSPATTPLKDPNGLFNGVGPAQYWWVDPAGAWTNGGGSNSFHFQFGIKGFYGAPMEFDGHVPQVYATWVNGLTAGMYYLRAWINGYVQTDISGTYVDYPFSVAAEEWAGDINTPMDLETSSWINKTVYFHDLPGTLQPSPIRGPDPYRYLIAEAYDADNVPVAMNFTQVPVEDRYGNLVSSWNITLNGFGMTGPVYITPAAGTMETLVPPGMKYFLYRYRHTRDYGIMPGTYTIRVYMRGYVQQEFELATISLSQSPAFISNHMYRGAGINMTIYSIDWEHPRIDRPWNFPGDEINVHVYNEAGEDMGLVRFWAGYGPWILPAQIRGSTVVPSKDWIDRFYEGSSKLKFNGSTVLEYWGPDTYGFFPYSLGFGPFSHWNGRPEFKDAGTGIWFEFGYYRSGFLTSPELYRTADLRTRVALETGTYTLKAWTLGYVQKKDISVYAAKGQQADTKINLVIGVNITVNIKFKKEGIFTHVPYNQSFRIRVFDDSDNLVATWYTNFLDGSAFYNLVLHNGNTAYGGYGTGPSKVQNDERIHRPWVRDSTTDLQVLLAGNYYYYEINNYGYVPYEERHYALSRINGIDGWPNYQGTWRIEVDAVNLYFSDRYFPAPPGLLLGESYHIINGVEGPYGGQFKYNHLGPWEQRMVVTVPNAHLGAEVSVIFELDLRGLLLGNIAGFTWSDELRPVSWASVTASGAEGTFVSYSWDGYYDMYLNTGSYQLTVETPGYASTGQAITVSTGQLVTGFSFYLERSNIPIPEFGAVIALVTALGASLYILRRTRRKR